MAQKTSIDSNVVGVRYAVEDSPGVVSGDENWVGVEPNSFGDFGAQIGTTARTPFTTSRQNKKGVTTSLSAAAAFNMDFTQTNLQDLLQGFLYADFRTKDELSVATVNTGGVTDDFEPAAGGDGYVANDLLFAKGFDDAANNGLHTVTGTPTATEVIVSSTLTVATGQTGTISRVGFEFAAGDLDVDISGDYATLTTATKDLTELGLIPGEWIFIGGDGAGESFTNAANNGYKRVKSVTTNALVIDKSDLAMVTEASTTETVQMFFGRVLKNESDQTLQTTRTYQLERQLGAPDDTLPAEIQAEYVVGAYPNEFTFNMAPEGKVDCDLAFVALDEETIDGPTALKAGTRPAITETDLFNTSSDYQRINLAVVSATSEAPTPLFAFIEEATLTISNAVTPNPALGVLGAAVVSKGKFTVSGNMTVMFQNLDAKTAVRNNDSVTFDVIMAKGNAGVALDIPLITLGDARAQVEEDQPIKLPLNSNAATGAAVDPNMDHTLLMCFFDYLPNAADV